MSGGAGEAESMGSLMAISLRVGCGGDRVIPDISVTGLVSIERGEGVSGGFGRDRELSVLAELCRELARFGLSVGLSDARPAVSVRTDLVNPRLWISVSAADEAFVWRRDDEDRHAVDDPAGAAAHIAEYVKARNAGAGGVS